ncbi:C4-dicarboxylate ABC transporter [Microvirga vignae]|uniref:C4-dicarboxylate ABC transporter n=1 Tax=Microvirga vignae TaxID=1225564 RepID=A0A0H1R8U5_9HYPH|nr:SLAC1 anion channel family protein [Microvirga vignae]KLK91655.1 C4-dicarboxylate ABC transporter [Microvirga vignae]
MTTSASIAGELPRPGARQSISQLPVNLFASVMGLAGLSLAWREAYRAFGLDLRLGEAAGWIAVSVFVILAVAYAAKFIRHRAAFQAEYSHPVMSNFFATIAIGLLLLSAFLSPYSTHLGQAVWLAGTLLTAALAYAVAQRFLSVQQNAEHTLPPLLIPGVATLDIAVTGASMPFGWAYEVNMFAFAVGSVLALVLVVLIFGRLRHQEPLPLAMRPSLMVLVAPFAVGFLAYTNLTGRYDMIASMLFYFGLFMFVVVSPKVFRRDVPFGITWWAISFPMAALSTAAFKYADQVGGTGLHTLAFVIFAMLTVAILILFLRTLVILINGTLLRV